MLLRLEFRELPPAVEARIESADADALAAWTTRLLTAETLDALFSG